MRVVLRNLMVLSSDKCYYLILGFNGSFPDFPFNYLTTENVTEGKILGIKIDSKLNFKFHLINTWKELTKNLMHSQVHQN